MILLSICHSQESQSLPPQPPPHKYENITPQAKLSRVGRVDESDTADGGSNNPGTSPVNGNSRTTDGDGDDSVFDPNLTCLGCRRKFKHGEIQSYRRHVRSCEGMTTFIRTKRDRLSTGSKGSDRGDGDPETPLSPT